MYLFIVKNTK